ncbi:hypothetical protein C8J57DRAFT_574111 [Mycena rebaudengoi]|nr:hypothetical protein C8J57DRAFT_574111 [Mycena rebaudengoi]
MPVFVGWSAGAMIIADICSHISPVPLRGVIAIAGPLCVRERGKTLKPKILEMLPKFRSTDAVTALNTRIEFVDSAFTDPASIPFNVKAAWIGSTVMQSPEVTGFISAGHRPDETKLLELGARGFPAMVLYGSEDQFQDGNVVAEQARPHFTDLEVAVVMGGSHSIFYDSLDETVGHILRFYIHVNSLQAGH